MRLTIKELLDIVKDGYYHHLFLDNDVEIKAQEIEVGLENPPCRDCKYWRPVIRNVPYTSSAPHIILCHKQPGYEIESDFSCFRPKEEGENDGKNRKSNYSKK